MKNSTITLLSIGLSLILAIGILIAVVAGFLYMGAMAWESGWARGDSLEGHDGYTYCIMHETGIGQDPHTKLIRTKNIKDENSYEDLGSVNAESSWLTVIRSTKISKGGHTIIYITSNNKAFAVSYNNYVPFIFDPENEVFYEGDDATMSPFILIENEDSDLYDPDVIRVIWRTVTDLSGWPASD
ncbi:MAG: hypothetical protein ISS71_08065, partial [Phycisphaerae bacterium]|nr:hypothetical protein [Phycisphaerae bacterium]